MLIEKESEILELLGANAGSDIEIEARFGIIKNGRYVNEIPYSYFSRLDRILSDEKDPSTKFNVIVKSQETDEVMDNIRKTTSRDEVKWMIKKRIYSYDSLDYAIRLSGSIEEEIEEIDPAEWNPTISRIKNRKSFIILSGVCRVDLTSVDHTDFATGITTNRHEIEVELLDPTRIDQFFDSLESVFKYVYGTEEIWTYPERLKLIKYTNLMLSTKKPYLDNIDTSQLTQLRNLRWEDMVFGGIVGNRSIVYRVTHKADGIRKLLVCNDSGVWLLYPPFEFNKLTNEVVSSIQGCVLQVEEMPYESRIKPHLITTKHWVLVVDCIAADNRNVFAFNELDTRMIKAEEITQTLNDQFRDSLATFGTKKMKLFDNPEGFFAICREFLDERPTLLYKDDGLIFMPIQAPYQPHTDKLPLNERYLTEYPDLCKWKPENFLTNDFAIHWIMTEGGKKLLLEVFTSVEEEFLINGQIPKLYRANENKYNFNNIISLKWDSFNKHFYFAGTSTRKSAATREDINSKLNDTRASSAKVQNYKYDFKLKKEGNIIRFYTSKTVLIPFKGTDEFPFDPKINLKSEGINLEELTNGVVVEFQLLNGELNPIKIRYDKPLPNNLEIAQDNWNQVNRPITEETLRGNTFDLFERNLERNFGSLLKDLSSKGIKEITICGNVKHPNFKLFNKVNVISDIRNLPPTQCLISYRYLEFNWNPNTYSTLLSNLQNEGLLIFVGIDGTALNNLFNPAIRGAELNMLKLSALEIYPPKSDGRYIIKEKEISRKITPVENWHFLASGFTEESSQRLDAQKLFHLSEKTYSALFSISTFSWKKENLVNKVDLIFVNKLDEAKAPENVDVHKEDLTEKDKSPGEKSEEISKKEGTLHMLPVGVPYAGRGSIIRDKPARNDDNFEKIKCSWYSDVVRIATIGDGSCFFHALMKACDSEYQENNEAAFRIEQVRQLRRDIAAMLDEGETYEKASGGVIAAISQQQKKNPKLVRSMGVNYSKEGLQKLINSKQDVGDEVYKLVADAVGVDIYVLRITDQDIYLHANTLGDRSKNKIVVIAGNTYHYELIGVINDENYIQVIFKPDHPFIAALRNK